MLLQLLLLALSFGMLYLGAELVLSNAEKIGKYLRLSPLVIGLLIIGFGTSLPELFVSQIACYKNHSGIALGNIVGSNIANVYLIMGLTATLVPLSLFGRGIKRQLYLHLGLSLILVFIFYRDQMDWISSVVLLIFFAIYLFDTIRSMRKSDERYEKVNELTWWTPVLLLGGFALLYWGGEILISSGSAVGRMVGISEYVISVIFVAFGTSFPELVTAMVACFKKKDINLITGNIIGSNIFNVAFVLMSVGWYGFSIPDKYIPELGVLIFASLYLLARFFIGKQIARKSGIIFLLVYVGLIIFWLD